MSNIGVDSASMRIGELSKITGVSIPTIRLYEREGLIGLADRTEGKFRVFSEEQRRRLDFIKRIRNLGFTLNDVKSLLALSKSGGEGSEDLIERLRSDIRRRQSDLVRLEIYLGSTSSSDRKKLDNVENAFATEGH